jgi:hypothetical protein
VTGIVNVTFHAVHAATVSWSMLPLGFYAFGMSLATPGLFANGVGPVPADAWFGRFVSGLRHGAAGWSGNA